MFALTDSLVGLYRHTLVPEPEVAGQAKHLLFPANEILNKTLPAQPDPTHTHPHTQLHKDAFTNRHTFQFSGTRTHMQNPCSPSQGLSTENTPFVGPQ